MRLFGKILVVAIFVFSVIFSTFSVIVFATHTNWHAKANELDKEVKALTATNQRLREDQDSMKAQLGAHEEAARKYVVAALHTQVAQATDQQVQANALLTQEQSAHATLVQVTSEATSELSRTGAELTMLRDENRTNREARDLSHDLALQLTDNVNMLMAEKTTMQERFAQLSELLARYQKATDEAGVDVNAVGNEPPRIDGKVTAVRKNLIEISVGSDDGLKRGHEVNIFRGSTYLGRVVVREAKPDVSVCEIIPDTQKGVIKKGDSAATRIID